MDKNCNECLHNSICQMWRDQERQDASSFQLSGCCHFKDRTRVIEPPCKPWDKVWVITKTLDSNAKFKPIICEGEIVRLAYNGFTIPMEWLEYRYETPVFGQSVIYDRIDLCLGKKIFLSRDEAEQALAKMDGGEP